MLVSSDPAFAQCWARVEREPGREFGERDGRGVRECGLDTHAWRCLRRRGREAEN